MHAQMVPEILQHLTTLTNTPLPLVTIYFPYSDVTKSQNQHLLTHTLPRKEPNIGATITVLGSRVPPIYILNSNTYLLVPVERVDDEFHHPVNLSLVVVLLSTVPQLLHLGNIHTVQLDGFFFPVK